MQTLYTVFTGQAVDGAVDRERFRTALTELQTVLFFVVVVVAVLFCFVLFLFCLLIGLLIERDLEQLLPNFKQFCFCFLFFVFCFFVFLFFVICFVLFCFILFCFLFLFLFCLFIS